MKLFQIEEPEGAPLQGEGPGAAVGIDLAGAVAVSVGGNAELLRGRDGATWSEHGDAAMLLGSLKARAEQALARPVTHAVIAGDDIDAAAIDAAAAAIGLTVLRLIPRAAAAAVVHGADGRAAAALGAAMLAEDLAARLSTVIC
ncbi:MAG TPA: Hsp70 family protein [Stellaceae bacterium]|nr:Hsp70 family protein [Stellaceae bacterium]